MLLMKTTKKVTLSAVMAALAAVLMLVSYFPYLTYAVPAVAGLCVMVIVIEINCKWALLSYFTASFFTFLFAETESMLMFICFFGFYPILKCLIEKIKNYVLEWILKLLSFNICIVGVYFILSKVFMISLDDLGEFAKYGEVILLLLANFVFVFYDIAVSRVSWFYIDKFHKSISKLFK